MAKFSFSRMDGLLLDMQELAELPVEVLDEMLLAQAGVVASAQREEAKKLGMYRTASNHNNTRDQWSKAKRRRNYLPGQRKSYSTGALARSVKVAKPKEQKGVRAVSIYFAGTRKRGKTRTKNSEIAFLNEFGTRTINQRNFVRTANQRTAQEATQAAMDVYDRWLKSKNL